VVTAEPVEERVLVKHDRLALVLAAFGMEVPGRPGVLGHGRAHTAEVAAIPLLLGHSAEGRVAVEQLFGRGSRGRQSRATQSREDVGAGLDVFDQPEIRMVGGREPATDHVVDLGRRRGELGGRSVRGDGQMADREHVDDEKGRAALARRLRNARDRPGSGFGLLSHGTS
jgi:hypothetical protein